MHLNLTYDLSSNSGFPSMKTVCRKYLTQLVEYWIWGVYWCLIFDFSERASYATKLLPLAQCIKILFQSSHRKWVLVLHLVPMAIVKVHRMQKHWTKQRQSKSNDYENTILGNSEVEIFAATVQQYKMRGKTIKNIINCSMG